MTAHSDATASTILAPAIGPFDVAAQEPEANGARAALVTGLLVLFPAFATVAAIVAGLVLAGGNGV